MPDKPNTGNRSDDFDERVSGAGDEEIRGVASDEDDEFEDADDLDEDAEEDEESTTF